MEAVVFFMNGEMAASITLTPFVSPYYRLAEVIPTAAYYSEFLDENLSFDCIPY